jgi:SMODS and SLOG-associating 2TM effector domain 1/SMODS and SLOG-associating 2TM effector domain 3
MTVFISIMLLLSIVATWVSKMQNTKNNWQHYRNVAESVKRISWFYMMRANCFFNLNETDADKLFLANISELRKKHQDYIDGICFYQSSEVAISDTMRTVRNLNTQDRNKLYLENRLNDQISWYFKKAKSYKMTGNRGQAMIMGAQALGIAGAIYIASNPESKFNPEGLFVNVALIIISWMEYQRYHQLSKLYMHTRNKLRDNIDQTGTTSDDTKLSEFVTESESEMEKEQFYWIL